MARIIRQDRTLIFYFKGRAVEVNKCFIIFLNFIDFFYFGNSNYLLNYLIKIPLYRQLPKFGLSIFAVAHFTAIYISKALTGLFEFFRRAFNISQSPVTSN